MNPLEEAENIVLNASKTKPIDQIDQNALYSVMLTVSGYDIKRLLRGTNLDDTDSQDLGEQLGHRLKDQKEWLRHLGVEIACATPVTGGLRVIDQLQKEG